jgi:diketogulonate reductase-like aldo/keto reductase
MAAAGPRRSWARRASRRRNEVFLVSKVLPHNASIENMRAVCERSLERLKTDRLDLYQLHRPGSIPLSETVRGSNG